MQVQRLLLKTLESLRKADFEKFQWYLSMKVLDGCDPISESVLENTSRTFTVRKMIEDYGEESAVNVTVAILEDIDHNNAAETLKTTYADGKTAAPSTSSSAVAPPAAPGARPAAPGARPAAPGARPAAPGARPAAPGARPAAPGARPAAPGARPAAPGARPAVPGARPAAPAIMLAQQDSVIIAPTITGGSYGSLNIFCKSPNPGNSNRPG